MKATMKDVAKLAGVGVGTVSRVLNNGSVKASTREKVEAAMTELNYQPDFYARGLKMKHTNHGCFDSTHGMASIFWRICLPCRNSIRKTKLQALFV